MPYVQVRLVNPRSADFAAVGAEATRLMAEVMRKRREVTVVEVIESSGAWFVEGRPVSGAAAYVDIKITRGTNSDSEKTRLLAEFQALLERELGPLAAPAYVVIHELPPADWGYGGCSQASRQSKASL